MKRKMYEELREALQIDTASCQKAFNRGVSEQETDAWTHKEQLLMSVRNMESVKPTKERIGFFEFMVRQIPFIGKPLWITQGIAAFAVFGILYLASNDISIRHIPLFVGTLAVMQVMASVPLLLMSYRYQMYEIELVSQMSFPRLLMAKMALLSIEYMAVFVFCVVLSTGIAGMSAVRVSLHFLLPLFAACTGCIQIIRHTGGWDEVSQRVGACEGFCTCLVAALAILYKMKPVIYDNTGLWTILIVCIFLLLIRSVCMWVKESEEVADKAAAAE